MKAERSEFGAQLRAPRSGLRRAERGAPALATASPARTASGRLCDETTVFHE